MVGRYVKMTTVNPQDLSFIGMHFSNASVLQVMRYTHLISSSYFRQVLLILCWGILANSSRRNCLMWPRLWFGVSRTRTALPNWSRRCPMASSYLSVLCGTFICLLDPNPCSCRRIMMVWSERRRFWTLARIPFARIPFAVTKWRRAAVPEILLSVSVGFFYGTTILGTVFDIPGISVPGHQTGNRWFVHTESQSNIMTQGPWLNHANVSVQIT